MMPSAASEKNFFKAHYDWLLALAGAVALVAALVYFVSGAGSDPESSADESVAMVKRMKPERTGVAQLDLAPFAATMRSVQEPRKIAEIPEKFANFLASERRVKCKCGKAIPGDLKAFPACPFCGEKQQEEKLVVLDADGDGLPDEWERKFSLNPGNAADAQADKDGDGFSNMEEYVAKTDPSDVNDHPDYFDSLKLVLPLKETRMGFVFRGANKIPSGWRLSFFDPKKIDDYGRKGLVMTAVVGGSISGTGFKVKDYVQKTVKEVIPGTDGLMRPVDASEAVLERESDGKVVVMTVVRDKKLVFAPIDIQATLSYERGGKTFEVVPGSKIELHSDKYRVVDIKAAGKGAEIEFEDVLTGKKRKLRALE